MVNEVVIKGKFTKPRNRSPTFHSLDGNCKRYLCFGASRRLLVESLILMLYFFFFSQTHLKLNKLPANLAYIGKTRRITGE